MAAPNPETRALYTRLQEVLGDDNADTLMSYLPSQPGTEPATRSDIASFEARLDERFAKVDERFEKLDERFEKLDERFEKLDERFEKLDERIYGLHVALGNQYKNYSITMVGGMTALTAIYAGLLAIITLVG
jgi:predicted nuclease with TOPRIM domain